MKCFQHSEAASDLPAKGRWVRSTGCQDPPPASRLATALLKHRVVKRTCKLHMTFLLGTCKQRIGNAARALYESFWVVSPNALAVDDKWLGETAHRIQSRTHSSRPCSYPTRRVLPSAHGRAIVIKKFAGHDTITVDSDIYSPRARAAHSALPRVQAT